MKQSTGFTQDIYDKHDAVMAVLKRGVDGYEYIPGDTGAVARVKFNTAFNCNIPNVGICEAINRMYNRLVKLGHIDVD